MTELSPAARAVLTAVTLTKYDVPPEGLPAFAEEMAPLLAAALRAAADQVVPEVVVSWKISGGYVVNLAVEFDANGNPTFEFVNDAH